MRNAINTCGNAFLSACGSLCNKLMVRNFSECIEMPLSIIAKTYSEKASGCLSCKSESNFKIK